MNPHLLETILFFVAILVVVFVMFLIPICGVNRHNTVEIIKKKIKKK